MAILEVRSLGAITEMPSKAPQLKLCGQQKISCTKSYDQWRGSRILRGYDGAWQRLRLAHLKAEPLCRHCFEQGLIVAAQEVDHIIPIRIAPDRRLDDTNLQSLCKSCHSVKTRSEQLINSNHG